MERSNPNPLLHALSAGKPVGEHPDAEILTAFAEGSLLMREREVVLGHLAGCAECREVLNLTAVEREQLPAIDLVAAAAPSSIVEMANTGRSHRKIKRVWPLWVGAAAACLAISVVAVRFGMKKTDQIAGLREEHRAVAVNAPPPAAPVSGAATTPQARQARPDFGQRDAKSKRSGAEVPRTRQVVPHEAPKGTGSATAEEDIPRAALSATNLAIEQDHHQVAAENSTQAVAMQDRKMTSAKAAPRAFEPALAGALAKSAKADSATRNRWRIDGSGHVERSTGDGPWEVVLPGEHAQMHVVAVWGQNVWVGGENDILYRSQDDGLTFHRVVLPPKNGSAHAIAQIRFESTSDGTIECTDGTTWTTEDGGATWR